MPILNKDSVESCTNYGLESNTNYDDLEYNADFDDWESRISDDNFFEDSDDDFTAEDITKLNIGTQSKTFKDDDASCSIEDCNQIMFEKSQQTVSDVIEMIVAYTLRFGDSLEARSALIEMFKICAGPDFKNLNLSNYKLSQVYDPPPENIKFHFYCKHCMKKVLFSSEKKYIKGQLMSCDICGTENCIQLSNEANFVTVDFEYQLKMLLEMDEIAEYFNPKSDTFLGTNNTETNMLDIHDGSLHKKAVKDNPNMITYSISTDGAPLFHVSKRGFWPLQIILHNLPLKIRFAFVFLVGIMIVKTEPKADLMNLFIDEFWKQARRLHYEGITSKLKNMKEAITIYFTPIFIVADSIARAILQNRLQFNGFFGCSYCYQHGTYFLKMGVKYPFLEKQAKLRTHVSHKEDLSNAKTNGSFVQGVKGDSSFMEMPNIDMIWGFPLDYLHNALLGVTQQIWNNLHKILKPVQRQTIDNLLLLIQPPRDLRRHTEKISNKSIWKATHWKSWLLYFCLPICCSFKNIENNLEHFAFFVNTMFILLKMNITADELDKCEQNLLVFVARYQVLYGDDRMTFNIHILLHFIQSIRESGPTWATSAFPFESNIHFLKQTINGPKSVEQQISKKSLSILQYRLRPPPRNISTDAKEFCKKIFTSKKSTKSAVTAKDVTFLGPNPKNIFTSFVNKEFERCIYNDRVYSSNKYSRSKKFDDTVMQLKSGDFVQITGIYLLPNNTCSFEVRKLIVKPFLVGSVIVSHIWEVSENVAHKPVSVLDIHSKAVVLDLKDRQYICEIPNTIEAQ